MLKKHGLRNWISEG